MKIQFAKVKSDVITKREGGTPETAAERKVKRTKKWAEEKLNPPKPKKPKPAAEIPSMSSVPAATQRPIEAPPPQELQMPNNILFIQVYLTHAIRAFGSVPTSDAFSTLILQNLPDEAASGILADLFRSCQGFVELRAIPGRSDIAFVEFDDEVQAGMVMQQYQGYKIGDAAGMTISYAKK